MGLDLNTPFGATLNQGGGERFRLWAPGTDAVALRLEQPNGARDVPMQPARDGWYETVVSEAGPGTRYRYVIGDLAVPDPVSRFQPEDVHGPSEEVAPHAYAWRAAEWRGRPWHET